MFMMNVFRNIDRKTFSIDFLIFSDETTTFSQEIETLGGHIYRLPSRRKGFIRYHKSLSAFYKISAQNYDAVHFCGGNVSSIAPIRYAYKYGIKNIIVHSHSSSCSGLINNILHRINRIRLTRYSTHRLACSSKAAEWFWRKAESTIIPNGINLEKFIYKESLRQETRNKLGINNSDFVIGHIGRFDSNKNHRKLISVFNTICQNKENSKLYLVGIGQDFDEIVKYVEQLGLSDNVSFLGERDDIPNILNAMDVFVMPSIFEGLPFVLLEAQACGLPCVVSSSINPDVKITPTLKFIDVKASDNEWAAEILQIPENLTRDYTHYLKDAGYSILETIGQLEQIYRNNENSN